MTRQIQLKPAISRFQATYKLPAVGRITPVVIVQSASEAQKRQVFQFLKDYFEAPGSEQ